ncbi:MAG: hypothetical protein AB2562_14255 [Candidatus Thiodiazotropha sp.]
MCITDLLKLFRLLSLSVFLAACGSGGGGDSSSDQSGADTEAPMAVSDVTSTTSLQSVTLSWRAATDNVGIDHYQITRDGVEIGTTDSTSFTDDGVNENSDYTYRVIAVDSAGNSTASGAIQVSVPANSNSGPDIEAPSPVSNLAASVTGQAVTLTWSPATDNVGIDYYQVTRDGIDIATTSSTSYVDRAVSQGTDYSYHVVAFDAAGNSTFSNALPVSVPANTNPGVVKAFPTAEGFGANASGGRNGQVVKVTNLNLGGAGSLQAALDIDAPRIVVFEVSGVIEGDIRIPYGDVTIAGQTAPGAGITIHGRLTCDYSNPPDNIILRHLRVRADHSTNPGVDGNFYDGIQCSRSANLIFDHLSVSGGVDETFDIFEAENVTLQWSTISRADTDGHPGGTHNYGLISGPNGANVSIHHNLFAHNGNRNPAVANGPCEIINNVVYNVRHGFVHHNPATGDFNIIGNYYRQGPENSLIPFYFDDQYSGSGTPMLSYYLEDNYVDDPGDLVGSVDNPWLTPSAHSSFENIDRGWNSSVARAGERHPFSQPVETVHDSLANFDLVLERAGAFPRDQIDSDNVDEVNARTGSWGARIPSDLMQGLAAGTPPADSDNDGMPDDWEESRGLSSSTPDHNSLMSSGYTAIEEYINELADQLVDDNAAVLN